MNIISALEQRLRRHKALSRLLDELIKRRELILYVVFGALTSLVSIVSFALCNRALGVNEHPSNVISWILAVTFAFVTNRTWVFPQPRTGPGDLLKQGVRFYAGRLSTLGVEELIIYIFITRLRWDSMLVKTAAQIIVIALNYVISKLFVFRKPAE